MSTHRASLLTGLRTGGPRSVSNGAYNAPQTAGISGQFPTSSVQFPSSFGYERELATYTNDAIGIPMTAPAKDATLPQLQQQQTQFMLLQAQAQAQVQAVQNAVMANQGGLPYGFQSGVTPEQQAMQLQFEVYKIQAMHQQQLQTQILQEAQRQMLYQQQQQQNNTIPRRRPSEPVTASPYITTFGGPGKPRAVSGMNEGSMTASLDGRFPPPSKLNPNATSFQLGSNEVPPTTPTNAAASHNWRTTERVQPSISTNMPATPSSNGVLSGGASLGVTGPVSAAVIVSPAKHTLATSWRRPSVAKTSDGSNSRTPSPSESPSASPPTVHVSTPEETSPVQSRSTSPPVHRVKPQPLHFHIPGTIVEQQDIDNSGGQILGMGRVMSETPSSPVTPTSGSPTHSLAREEAARRLYEGLGIGRPNPQASIAEPVRNVSQPSRQPHGPPSGVEDLGARNFAARIRRKAIGGLGVLMDARGRRTSMIEVEAY